MIESDDDRRAFFSSDEFAVTGTYTPFAGEAVSGIEGIYNDPHLSIDMGEGATSSDSQPTFLCPTSVLPSGAKGGDAGDLLRLEGQTLPVGGLLFKVTDLRPDGTGLTLVILGAK